MRSLSRYQLRPDISHLLPHCLLKNARMRRQKSRLFLLFLPISWFHSWNLRKPESSAFFPLLRHSFNFIHIWAVLNFTVLQQRKFCKHKNRCWISFKGIGDWAQLPELDDHYVIFTLLQEKKGQLQPLSSRHLCAVAGVGKTHGWEHEAFTPSNCVRHLKKPQTFRMC